MAKTPRVDLMRPADGWQRCCICFTARRFNQLFVDEKGQKWDLCADDLDNCAEMAGFPKSRSE